MAAACFIWPLRVWEAASHDLLLVVLAVSSVAAARFAPVALPHHRPLTFSGAAIFFATALAGSAVAGCAAIASLMLHVFVRRRHSVGEAVVYGTQYALASTAASAALGPPNTPPDLARYWLGALAFTAVNSFLALIWQATRGRLRREALRPALCLQGLIYAASLPASVMSAFAVQSQLLPGLLASICLFGVAAALVRRSIATQLAERQLLAIAELAELAGSRPTAARAMSRLIELSATLTDFDAATVWSRHEGSGEFRPGIASENRTPLLDAETLRPLAEEAAEKHGPLARVLRQEGATLSFLAIPVEVGGKAVAVAIYGRRTSGRFHPEEIRWLGALAPHASAAFEGATLRSQVRQFEDLAAQDGLTGLWNHRRGQEILRDEIRRAQRYGRSLTILMTDVDGFKQFNDTYGHPRGDQLLQEIARILKAGVREVDYVCRYGGEEFLVILPETGPGEAAHIAERLRSAVERHVTPTGADGTTVSRTISIGLSSYPLDGDNAASLIEAADGALYKAKRLGKNRVLVA